MTDRLPPLITELLRRQGAALLYARQWTTLPDDVVQEAFVRLAAEQRLPDSPTAWLYKTVRRRAINAGRAERRRGRHEAAAGQMAQTRWFQPDASSSAIDADDATRALGELDQAHREVIVTKLWGGMTFQEIADLTGSSTSTVHRQYQAGIQSLRERLGVLCPNDKNSTTR